MTLTAPYDPDNAFGRILRGEVPAAKVWEDDHVLAFMDAFPQSEGHVLVISKTSTSRTLLDVEPDVLARMAVATQRTARAVVKALGPEGFLIVQLNGEASGQTVFHLHFHVIPRWAGIPMKGHGQAPMGKPETLLALAGRIAAALD
jgi:histidine triad (HIT) family protein